MQGHGVDHQIMRLHRQIKRVVVFNNLRAVKILLPKRLMSGHEGRIGKGSVNHR